MSSLEVGSVFSVFSLKSKFKSNGFEVDSFGCVRELVDYHLLDCIKFLSMPGSVSLVFMWLRRFHCV